MDNQLCIEKEIIDIIRKYVEIDAIVQKDSDLIFDLQFNSLQFIQLLVEIEEKFDIEFPDEYLQIEKMDTVKSICFVVETTLKQRGTQNAR